MRISDWSSDVCSSDLCTSAANASNSGLKAGSNWTSQIIATLCIAEHMLSRSYALLCMYRFGVSTQPTLGAYRPRSSKSLNDTPGHSGTGRAYTRRPLTYPDAFGRRLHLPDPQAPSTRKGWTHSARLTKQAK